MRFTAASVTAAVAGLVALADGKLMESLHNVPAGWKTVGKPDPSQMLHFRIAMNQPNEGLFEQMFYDIATPGHSRYGQHLKREQLKELLRPNPDATAATIKWLTDSGISSRYIVDDGEWINFYADVATAEAMLDTEFDIYSSTNIAMEKIRTIKYSVPDELVSHIDMIQPTTRFGEMRGQRNFVLDVEDLGAAGFADPPPDGSPAPAASPDTNVDLSACNATITPTCLRALYHVSDVPGLDPAKSGFLGIAGYLEEYARYDDFQQFTELYAPYLNASNFTYQLINGGLDDQASTNDSVEANLDAQYGLALSYPVNATYYSTGGRGLLVPDLDQPDLPGSNEPYLDFLTYILAQDDDELPHTLTTSYGENEQSVPESYTSRVCSMFAQLGARGVSVLFSSGDTGPGSACQSNDGLNRTIFNPTFPASCASVTAVGGTVGVQPERAVSFSSGGFSERNPRPAYQDAAVQTYLDSIGDTFAGLYNPAGRGFPDVAAQGSHFRVIDSGRDISVGGTSASSPTFAGIVALLNAARLNAGLPPLGFLNPWIYGTALTGFTDIVDGGSRGCTGVDQYSGLATPVVPGAGWNATDAWDPVTGNGTPLFDKLLAFALADVNATSSINATSGAYRLRNKRAGFQSWTA